VWQRAGPLTFRQLDDHVTNVVEKLREIVIGRGSRVAFVAARRCQEVALYWALWRLRAIACPISSRFPSRQQQQLAAHVAAAHILEEHTFAPLFAPSGERQSGGAIRDVEPELAATILFSSGTTQSPKAVVHTLESHFASAQGAASNIPLGPGDRWLASLPLYHVGGLAIVIRCVLAGATVVLHEPAVPLALAIHEQRVTHCSIVPAQLRQLLKDVSSLSTLKALLLGGSPCGVELLRQAVSHRLPLHTTYGLTEMASQVTTTAAGCAPDKIHTAGQALPGRELRIEQGEILVRGATLCLGYYRDGSIVPVVDQDGWFHTGDAGFLDKDGYLTVTGRLDEMFISGGENIHPEAIESRLLSLPGIRQAVIVPVDDVQYGKRPVAYVDADPFTPGAWEQALREQLPSFMIPDTWLPWPQTEHGAVKVSRRRLQQLAARQVRR
jgi:O-succinylbenzoic acid--CoA ligase